MFKNITKTVWLLSLISLFNDFSSEMLYPIIPLFLQQAGYSSVIIGFLEGIAECIAGITKIATGKLSDQYQKRLPFIQLGYGLSILSRPITGLSSMIGLIFIGRSSDRIGKGLRTGARDALLSDESSAETKSEIFGFHRSMDTFGAVLGPLAAMGYLYFQPNDYKSIFLITLIPGLFALLFTFFIKEKQRDLPIKVADKKNKWSDYFTYYKTAPKIYLQFLYILILFSLANSSDMFLLLRAKELGFSEQSVLMMYLLFNLCYALFAFPIGKLSNRFGVYQMLILGLFVYALTYFIFAFAGLSYMIWIAFIFYGLYYAFTQGAIKVLLIQKVPSHQKASAIGFYEGLNSFGLLLSNVLTGFIWFHYGAQFALLVISIIVLLIAFFLIIQRKFYT